MYQYQVYTNDRQILEGVIDAESEDTAEERLLASGYHRVLTLKKVLPPFSLKKLFSRFRRVQKPDVVDFFHQLATLIDSRMPFVQALGVLAGQAPKSSIKNFINTLGRDVAAGVPFSTALEHYPQLVPSHYTQVIRVSEQSGDLVRGLTLVAGYMDKENATGSRVARMVAYPAFLGFMGIVVLLVVSTVAVPSLTKLFHSLGVALPLATRTLVSVANFITHYKFHMVLGIALIVFIVVMLKRNAAVKRVMDSVAIRLPVIGSIVILRNVCRFCRSSALLIEAGLTLPQALNTIIGTVDSNVIKNVLTEVRQEIIKGKGLAQPLSRVVIFPRLLVDMVSIGEKTSTLQASFASMADYYEKQLDQKVHRLMSLIEPASIIIVGLIIAFIGVSIITPLYSMYKTLH